MLTIEEVAHIAELAKLQLSDSETEEFREQLSQVLDYVARISELDLTAVVATQNVLPMPSALRKDEVRRSLPREQLMLNAPEPDSGCFRVSAVLDET